MITSPIHSFLLTVKRVDVPYSINLHVGSPVLPFHISVPLLLNSACSPTLKMEAAGFSQMLVCVCTRVLGVMFQKEIFIDTPNLKSHIVCLLLGVTLQDTVLKKSDL